MIASDARTSIGRSCNLPLPAKVYQRLEQGEELGFVMDDLFNTKNIKQQGGAIGLLTITLLPVKAVTPKPCYLQWHHLTTQSCTNAL